MVEANSIRKERSGVIVKIEERAFIRATPERVWALLTDWERQPEWMPDLAWIRVVGELRAEGAELEARTRVFGIPAATDRIRVTGWEPPRRLVVEHIGVVVGEGEWDLDPAGSGTRFVWREAFRMPPRLLGDVALFAYSPWQRWMLRRSVRSLKALAEAGGPGAAAR